MLEKGFLTAVAVLCVQKSEIGSISAVGAVFKREMRERESTAHKKISDIILFKKKLNPFFKNNTLELDQCSFLH